MMDVFIAYIGMVLTAMLSVGLVSDDAGIKYSRSRYWARVLVSPFIICTIMVFANNLIFASLPELKRMYCG